jgi:hypothetical protein
MQNPRLLQAFQEMLGDPEAVLRYSDDPELGPAVREVFSTLHAMGLTPAVLEDDEEYYDEEEDEY